MPTASIHRLARISLSIFIVSVVASTTACSFYVDRIARTGPAQQPVQQQQAQSNPPKERVPSNDPDERAFAQNIYELLRQRDFQKLEELGASVINNKARFKGGTWKSYDFDQTLSDPPGELSPDDAAWESHISMLQEWANRSPDSILAKTALANAYIGYAWYARGDGWASSVKPEAWTKVNERIEHASKIAEEALKLQKEYTGYFELLLLLAKVQGWERKSFDAAFDAAVKFEPTYYYFYLRKAEYLMPRWQGAQGEWEDFAERTKADLGGKQGQEMYFVIVSDISGNYGNEFFDQNRVSWQETKKGFELWKKDFGMDRYRLSQLGRLAIHANDPPTACAIFSQLQGDNDFEPDVWVNRKEFESYRTMAVQYCKTPWPLDRKPRD